MIKATLQRPKVQVNVQQRVVPSIKIKAIGGQIQPSNPMMISANMGSVGRFDGLIDVEEGPTPLAGSVPVYDPDNDKYVVTQLDFNNLSGDMAIDGGGF